MTNSASAADFLQITELRSQEMQVSPPYLSGRDDQVRRQCAAILHAASDDVSWSNRLLKVLQLFLNDGVDTACLLATNAVALTAVARKGQGAVTGWEPRAAEKPESYLENARKTASASLLVATPVSVALSLLQSFFKPVVGALSHAASGQAPLLPTPSEIFFPDPSQFRSDGSKRSAAEFEAAWEVVKKGRKGVLERQAQFSPGGSRDLVCELAHPLAFALQGLALDFRDERPGILTVGGITLATATIASGLAGTILDALKTTAMFHGVDEAGKPVNLHLFEHPETTSSSTLRERLGALPTSISAKVWGRYHDVTGGADSTRATALALAAECVRSLVAVLVLNGVTALIDPLNAQFGRSPDESRNAATNMGVTLLSATLATVCFRAISGLLDRQRAHRTGRRELAQQMEAFHADWISGHAREVAVLHDRLRDELALGLPRTTADRIVFDAVVQPMMNAMRKAFAVHKTLYVHARHLDPGKLRIAMLTDHASPVVEGRKTIYLDGLLKLPSEFPFAYKTGRTQAQAAGSFVIQLDAENSAAE